MLEGKVAVVSGIGPGMGRDISLAFAREGADVALLGRTAEKLESVAAEVEALGQRALPVVCDIADESACDAAAASVVDALGRLDIVVNNAYHGGHAQSFMDADFDKWREVMDVNLYGSLAMTRACVPHLEASGDGRVVMINTMSVQRIQERWGSYAASKGALATVTKTLALELGPKGIRVNAVHPGYIWGPSVKWYFEHLAEERGVTPQEVYDEVASQTSLGYIPDAAEIAGVVVLLASDLARCVTGQAVGANAGQVFH